MIVGADGSERGPFEMAELRWMWRRNQIDDGTMLKAEGAAVAVRANAMAGELDAAGEEIEVVLPTWEAEPPELPGRSGGLHGDAARPVGPAQPTQALGLSDRDWLKVLAVPVVLVFAAGVIAAGYNELSGKNAAQKAHQEAIESRAAQQRQEAARLFDLAASWGKKDGIEIAAAVSARRMSKPSRVHILSLGMARVAVERITNPADQKSFLEVYESHFKTSYKSTLDW